jgi:hypothetical protein
VRNLAFTGSGSRWQVNYLNAEDSSRNTVEVNGGAVGSGPGGAFVWKLGEAESFPSGVGPYGELDIYLEKFGGDLNASNCITSIMVLPKVVLSGSELPAGMWGTPNTYPLFALDPAVMGAALDSAHAGMIATAAALLENIYRRRQPTLLSVSRGWNGELEQRMWNGTSSYVIFAKIRASALLSGSPGVGFLIRVEDSKFSGDGTLRLTAGGNTTTIPNASLGTGTWTAWTALNCKPGDVVKVEGNHIKIGTIMIFGREATP